MKKVLTFIVVVGLLSGFIYAFNFKGNALKPSDYFNWFNSKICSVSKWEKSDPMLFNVIYHSEDYMVLSELNGEAINDEKVKTSRKNYKCCEHFLLKIFSDDTVSEALSYKISNEQQYYDRIQYLNAEFGSRTYLIHGKDTLKCTFYHFERTYKMRPYISMNLIYEKKNINKIEPMVLVIEPTIFNQKQIRINFEKNDLDQIPKLKL